MKKERIIFEEEVYEATSIMKYISQEALPYVQYWTMDDLMDACDIRFDRYGFVHDCGFTVVLVEHGEQRHGTGWDEVEANYKAEVEFAKWRWEMAIESYHGYFD